jgi:SAM-dependent methyltransferase
MDVVDGGERVIHLWPNDCYLAHLSIYHFAAPFCQNGTVLDAGSGTGYGSAYLAEHGARFVCGIDIGEKAVAFSRHYFQRPNLTYRVMDLEKIAGFPDRTFDLIFSSNALEHVRYVPAFFHAAWRLLKPTGKLLIVVPPINTPEARAADLANKYHLNSWSPRQWHQVLSGYFSKIDCYRHFFDKPGVRLNFGNQPSEVVITEADFTFNLLTLEEMYRVQTFSAIFLASGLKPARRLPRPGSRVKFIDDSFTRRPPGAPAPLRPAQRLLRSPVLRPIKALLPRAVKARLKALLKIDTPAA